MLVRALTSGGGSANCVVGTIPSTKVVAGGTITIPINFTPKYICFTKNTNSTVSNQRGLYWVENGTNYIQEYGDGSAGLYSIAIGTAGNSVPAIMSKSNTEVVLKFPNNSADAPGEWFYMISDAVGDGYTVS